MEISFSSIRFEFEFEKAVYVDKDVMAPYSFINVCQIVMSLIFYLHIFLHMSRDMRFPTGYVRPVKPHISLRMPAVWSEPLLVAWMSYEC